MTGLVWLLRTLHRRRWPLLLGLLAVLWLPGPAAGAGQAVVERQAPATEALDPLTDFNFQLTPAARRAYAELLKLRPAPARALLRPEEQRAAGSAGTLLVADCIEFTELMITQDARRYEPLIDAQDERLARLEKSPEQTALRAYVAAEIRLHQAAAQVAFQHEIQGAWSMRQAYAGMQQVVRRYPSYLPARKTLGMMQFFIGSLPEGYRWFLKLLGLPGSVEAGLLNLRAAAGQPNDFQPEARIMLALVEETYYKKTEQAVQLASSWTIQQPDNLLFSYLAISLNKRQHHTEAALAAYRARPTGAGYLPVAYLHHMAADLLLYQGQYAASERENLQFLREFQGQHYRKDAAFKLYLTAWLRGDKAAAERYRRQIGAGGRTVVEEDTYAQRFYDGRVPLNATLTRARLQIDGGYYREALATLDTFRPTRQTPLRDQIEAPYRRARAWQGLGRTDSARLLYRRTIAVAGDAPYYFAPQSALQLGYLYQAEGQKSTARAYFRKVLAYPKHEYKNSTDTKAKVALQELD
ncbi:tetratricopeptide repeat protein [Hymenobacter guriensis]|uniref:DUF3808 domain-containing protein n=1 Tax=Hymenobacter guriensis TaxID=2793065 RepID=A0ABS0L1R3_9BACT|nr:DUF3808 domain-containing protein [Hymenobacter guriensis]MBG8554047.1 DUF3808 domain-containing protein [Hymenobacter guriensis]